MSEETAAGRVKAFLDKRNTGRGYCPDTLFEIGAAGYPIELRIADLREISNACANIKNPSAIKGLREALDSFFNDDDTDLEDWSRRARQALNALNGE